MKFYEDWWFWTFWTIFAIAFVDFISNLHTLQRWKYGFWSIDLLPSVVIFFVLWMWNDIIGDIRRNERINKLERKLREVKNGS